jgi:histidinol dehydrogenase
VPSLAPEKITKKAMSDFALGRGAQDGMARETASRIVDDVRQRGLDAIQEYTEKLDGVRLGAEEIAVPQEEMLEAAKSLLPQQKQAMLEMKGRIETFAALQRSKMGEILQEGEEGRTSLRFVPVRRVGIYVPAGRAPLFSSLFMAALPSIAAGVEEIVVCTPPQKDSSADGLILAAAGICGIEKVFKIGGAQAIAAMAFGLPGLLEPVDVICGPGNAYVSAAKQRVAAEGVKIDVPAGPSEVLIVADDSANPIFIAADMLAQSEHGQDSAAICICLSMEFASMVAKELALQLDALPSGSPARQSIPKWGRIFVAGSLDEAMDAANSLAIEHLELFVSDPGKAMQKARDAGAVFIDTAEAFCDYGMSGGNHILPTGRAARAWGGVSVQTFGKWMYVESLGLDAQNRLSKTAALLARMEGLEAHARAAEKRCFDEDG